VVDRWESAAAYDEFVAEHRDSTCSGSTRRLPIPAGAETGTFEGVW
jgi:hypothetical protein